MFDFLTIFGASIVGLFSIFRSSDLVVTEARRT